MHLKRKKRIIILIITILILIIIGVIYFYFFQFNLFHQNKTNSTVTKIKTNNNIAFIDEIYNKIKTHYWDKIDDNQLNQLYKLAAEKITGQKQDVLFNDIAGVNIMVKNIVSSMQPEEQKDFIVKLSNMVLANLKPFGRSGLFSHQQTVALQNNVNNVDPQTNLYKILEVDQNASIKKITTQYQKKEKAIKEIINNPQSNQEEKQNAQQNLALVKRAFNTLSQADYRERYDKNKIESVIDAKLLSPQIFYIHIKKISPTSFEDFTKAVQSTKDHPEELNTLILDLRDNVGGSVDLMQWFLGLFIGQNNLAYEFYHQGEYEPFKTKTNHLPTLNRYKKIIILINQQTQSSAEVMAATLKKYHIGILIGTKTKGWGTIERVFPLEHQLDKETEYSLFLVHSLTTRDDHQPIEGQGVEPNIDITQTNWEKDLLVYFNSPKITNAIKQLWFNQL